MRRILATCCLVLTIVFWPLYGWAQAPAADSAWTEFRGAGGRGQSVATNIPKAWANRHLAWKTPVPGRGWSSPVIAENQIWMTTAVEHKAEGSEKVTRIELQAVALDRNDGHLIHQVPLFDVSNPPALHLRNSYASPTPVIAGDRVFCSFGTMGLAAIDRKLGKVLWKNEELKIDHETGAGSSPIVWNNLVFLNYDGTDRQLVAAFDAATGKLAWQTKRSGKLHETGMYQKAFSTPVIWDSPKGPQLISAGANWVYGYSPTDGQELWKVDYGKLGFSNVPRPLLHQNKLIVCTGYMRSTVQAFALPDAENPQPKLLWAVERGGPTIPSPILVGDLLYMVSDDGIATCVDAENGEQVWSERLKGAFAASPILVEGHLWFCNDDGKVFVIEPSRSLNIVATNDIEDQIMATPAAIDFDLIIRTKSSVICIRNPDPAE
jgi:outer membrane protein assembly factor BamB